MFRLGRRTLGLVGFGKIPRKLLPRARAFGFEVLVHDPYVEPQTAREAGVELVDFDTLLGRSDFVSIHCPLTDETRNLFDDSAFKRMKPTAFLINTSRGGIVDLPALARALRSGTIAGAGLDVLPQEPPAASEEILRLDNVVLTPHTAWYSEESIIDLHRAIGRNVALVCAGRRPPAVVNPEVLEEVKLD